MNSENFKPELLAPAGGAEQLHYAIKYGADAVYLSGKRFGMRAQAGNFDDNELQDAITYAHKHDVKTYVTVNTSMNERDLAYLPDYFKKLNSFDADAVLISDLGAMGICKEVAPNLPIHISTQFSCTNSKTATMLYELGVKRVVLARELSLKEIQILCAKKPKELEVEVFVHGAMCMAYSGRCLISSHMERGRNANRGLCIQPCRWSYEFVEKNQPDRHFQIEEDERGSYLFNAEDLNMIEHLDELAKAGVSSLKIEGRAKRVFYVATVVNAYRAVLDGADPQDFLIELNSVSHRPYGTGFYFGEPSQTTDTSKYTQETILVATVSDVHTLEDGLYQIDVEVGNKFYEGDELEMISPIRPIPKVKVCNLEWYGYHFGPDEEVPKRMKDVPKNKEKKFGPVTEASRTGELYRFTTDNHLLEKGDLLRKRVEIKQNRLHVSKSE